MGIFLGKSEVCDIIMFSGAFDKKKYLTEILFYLK